MKSAFIPFDERLAIIGNVSKSWYADQLKARASAAVPPVVYLVADLGTRDPAFSVVDTQR